MCRSRGAGSPRRAPARAPSCIPTRRPKVYRQRRHESSSEQEPVLPNHKLSPQAALIYTMVLAAAADREMTDGELRAIEEMIVFLPAFRGFDISSIAGIASDVTDLLAKDNGLDIAFRRIKAALRSSRLRECAYALACDIVAADGVATQEE